MIQMLTTRGVNSCVVTHESEHPDKGERPWTKYHVGLFDFDQITKGNLLDKITGLEGINILWRSSETSYHLWNLTLREPEEIALIGLELNADCKHVGHGLRRRKWVLRITGKFRDDETAPYKDAPKPEMVWYNRTARKQSLPHTRLYEALSDKKLQMADAYTLCGESLHTEDYRTLTDRMMNPWKCHDGF